MAADACRLGRTAPLPHRWQAGTQQLPGSTSASSAPQAQLPLAEVPMLRQALPMRPLVRLHAAWVWAAAWRGAESRVRWAPHLTAPPPWLPCPLAPPCSHEEFSDHDLKWATRMTCGYW